MPQIVKGGKYIFGWSRVGDNGEIRIPPEAFQEYDLKKYENLILIPGSKRSGGFGLTSIEKLKKSPLGSVLEKDRLLKKQKITRKSNGLSKIAYFLIRDDSTLQGCEF
jgi:hypothetical protein